MQDAELYVQQGQSSHHQQHGHGEWLADSKQAPPRAQPQGHQQHHTECAEQGLPTRCAEVVAIEQAELAADVEQLRVAQSGQRLLHGHRVDFAVGCVQRHQRSPAAAAGARQQGIHQGRGGATLDRFRRDVGQCPRALHCGDEGAQALRAQRAALRGLVERGLQGRRVGQGGTPLRLRGQAGQQARHAVEASDAPGVDQLIEPRCHALGVAQRGLRVGALHDDECRGFAARQLGAQLLIQLQGRARHRAQGRELIAPQLVVLPRQQSGRCQGQCREGMTPTRQRDGRCA